MLIENFSCLMMMAVSISHSSVISSMRLDYPELVKWSTVQEVPVDTEFLKMNCIETQRTFFESFGSSFDAHVDEIDVTVLQSVLHFHNLLYKPMKVSVVKYSVSEPMRSGSTPTYRYLTGGDESDCVFYLAPFEDDDKGIGFYLDDPVCDSKLFRRQVVPSARDLKNTLNNIPAD